MSTTHSKELPFAPSSAWQMVGLLPVLLIGAWSAAGVTEHPAVIIAAGLLSVIVFLCLFGFFIVTPNHSKVLVLFGRYRGTVRAEGFYWTNPFTQKGTVSLRAHNVASEKIKVND